MKSIVFVGDSTEPGETIFPSDPPGELLSQVVTQYFPAPNSTYRIELSKCPNIEEALDALNPNLIITLGNNSLKTISKRSGITSWSGRQVGTRKNASVFALLHPGYVLHKPTELPKFEADCKSIQASLDPSKVSKVPRCYEITNSEGLEKLTSWREKKVAWDLETSAFSVREGGKVRTWAFSDGKEAYWINVEKEGSGLLEWFVKEPIQKVGHNSPFESGWSLELFKCLPKKFKWDSMLLGYLVNENAPLGLDRMAMEYLKVPNWDIAQKMEDKEWTYASIPVSLLGPYNALDALYCYRLVQEVSKRMTPELWNVYWKILLPLSRVCTRLKARGIYIDKAYCEKTAETVAEKISGLDLSVRSDPAIEKWNKKNGKNINLGSPKQLADLLYRQLRCPVLEKTKKGAASTAAPVLKRIAVPPPFLASYLEWKEWTKARKDYLVKFPTFSDSRGLIHADFNPNFVVTGRLSVSNPPLDNVTDDPLIRGMFSSRFKRGKMVCVDYKQLEIVLLANASGDPLLLKVIRDGLSMHDVTAEVVYGEKYKRMSPEEKKASPERAIAKRINFLIMYGGTEHKIQKEFQMSLQKATDIMNRVKRGYSGVFLWMKKQYARAEEKGCILSPWGRVRRLEGIEYANWSARGHMLRQAGNFPIQSAGADLTNRSCILVDKELRRRHYRSMLVLNQHDSLLLDCPEKEVSEVSAVVVNIMTKVVPKECPWLKLALEVDVKVSDRWGGLDAA